MPIITMASQFASCGYHVFPQYIDKHNVVHKPFGWAKNKRSDNKPTIPATTDLAEIACWPETVQRLYHCEIYGYGVLGLGIIIIDIDIKGDKTGVTEFKELKKKYKIPEATMMTKTKSGGLHLYFRKSDKYKDVKIKSTVGIKINSDHYPSIDIRGDSGFVVGPSKFVNELHEVEDGDYGMKGFCKPEALPLFPDKILSYWNQSTISDVDNMMFIEPKNMEIKDQVRRGILPNVVPKGARNDTFFAFVNALKYQGATYEVTKSMCLELVNRCEEPETLSESVDIDDMLKRSFEAIPKTAKDVAFDLIVKGLFQVVGYKATPHYVILEENPYIQHTGLYNETMMETLLVSYASAVTVNGKPKLINPINMIPKMITDNNRVDMIGFKPGAGDVFSTNGKKGSKKFLNTYRAPYIKSDLKILDNKLWNEFTLLVSRLFGPIDSDEFQLGMDFISWMLQRPYNKPNIAPFIISMNRGVGKSLLFNLLTHIMGSSKVGDPQAKWVKIDEITGRFFNPTNCLINLIDEVQFAVHAGMRKESTTFWRQLKSLITSEVVSVEIKGGETFQMPNTAAIFLAGNSGQYFPVEEFDRRLWVIDAEAPLLELGTVDSLFELLQMENRQPDYYDQGIQVLRYQLMHHKIKNNLAVMKAPMTAVKQELYEDGLTDIEAWFFNHFKDTGNVFGFNPVISKSALEYTFDTFSGLSNEKDLASIFRSLKRKHFIRPIKLKSNTSLSRQFSVPEIGLDGMINKKNIQRQVLYTTKDHGSLDGKESPEIVELFNQNCATIQRHRTQQKTVTSESLLYGNT